MACPFPQPSTFITQLMTTSTPYMIATLIFLYDEITIHTLNKFKIVLKMQNWLFFTLSSMLLIKTFWAVFLSANITRTWSQYFNVDHSMTLFFRTQFEFWIFWNKMKPFDFFINYKLFFWNFSVNSPQLVDLCFALFLRAINDFIAFNFGINVIVETLFAKFMFT